MPDPPWYAAPCWPTVRSTWYRGGALVKFAASNISPKMPTGHGTQPGASSRRSDQLLIRAVPWIWWLNCHSTESPAFVVRPYLETALRRVKDATRGYAAPDFACPELADEFHRPTWRQRRYPPPHELVVRCAALCVPKTSSMVLTSRVATRPSGRDDHRSCACGSSSS